MDQGHLKTHLLAEQLERVEEGQDLAIREAVAAAACSQHSVGEVIIRHVLYSSACPTVHTPSGVPGGLNKVRGLFS